MLSYIVEFLGTFLFASVVVATGQPLLIALSLLLIMLLGQASSGAHFNPALSVMFWAKGALTNVDLLGYIVAQVLGGIGALTVFNILTKKSF